MQDDLDLIALFKERHPELDGVRLEMNEETLEIGAQDDEPVIWLSRDEYQWTVWTKEAHRHAEEPDELVDVAAQLLRGEVRGVVEYRGEMLAGTWFEFWDGEAFEQRATSIYLCPFDADEWELHPGEQWKQVRTSRTYVPETRTIAVSEFERFSDESQCRSTEREEWLETGLGAPAQGMRWTVGIDSRLVFQAPKGWRRRPFKPGDQFRDFVPPTAEGEGPWIIFRTRNFYRDAETALPEPVTTAVSPQSVERSMGEETDWRQHIWTATFSDGENDMMAIFDLFIWPSRQEDARPFFELIDATVGQALFVPQDWNVSRE